MSKFRLGFALALVGALACTADAALFRRPSNFSKSVTITKNFDCPGCQKCPNGVCPLAGEEVTVKPEDGERWYTVVVTKDGRAPLLKWFRLYRRLKALAGQTTYCEFKSSDAIVQERFSTYIAGRYPAVIVMNGKGHVAARAFGKDAETSQEHLADVLQVQVKAFATAKSNRLQVTTAQYSKTVQVEKGPDGLKIFKRRQHNDPGPGPCGPVNVPNVDVDINSPPSDQVPDLTDHEEGPAPESEDATGTVALWVGLGVLALAGAVTAIVCWRQRVM